jgi:hypothetical protein
VWTLRNGGFSADLGDARPNLAVRLLDNTAISTVIEELFGIRKSSRNGKRQVNSLKGDH